MNFTNIDSAREDIYWDLDGQLWDQFNALRKSCIRPSYLHFVPDDSCTDSSQCASTRLVPDVP